MADLPTLLQFEPAFAQIAYAAFCGAPMAGMVVRNARLPFMAASPDGRLPVLCHGNRIVPHADIFEYLKRSFADLDAGLSMDIGAQIKAYSVLIESLNVALDIARFDEQERWLSVTRKALMEILPWPSSYVLAYELRRKALARIAAATTLTRSQDKLHWAREQVKNALQALAIRMPTTSGSSGWILGTVGPTSLDALVWGFLANARDEHLLVDVANDYPGLHAFYRRGVERIAKSKFGQTGGQNVFVLRSGGPFLSMRDIPLVVPAPDVVPRIQRTAPPPVSEDEKELVNAANEALVFAVVVTGLYWAVFVR